MHAEHSSVHPSSSAVPSVSRYFLRVYVCCYTSQAVDPTKRAHGREQILNDNIAARDGQPEEVEEQGRPRFPSRRQIKLHLQCQDQEIDGSGVARGDRLEYKGPRTVKKIGGKSTADERPQLCSAGIIVSYCSMRGGEMRHRILPLNHHLPAGRRMFSVIR